MLANMASSLIMHKRIRTTLAKAKALRLYVEPILTKTKEDTTHSRRMVFSYLQDKNAITELFREIAPKIADRPGGYLRILKTGKRIGDNAEMALVELVDYNEAMLKDKKAAKAKTTRRAGSRKKAETADETATPATAKVEHTEEPVAEIAPETEVEKPEVEVETEVEPEAEVEATPEAETTPEVEAEQPEATTEAEVAPETEEEKN